MSSPEVIMEEQMNLRENFLYRALFFHSQQLLSGKSCLLYAVHLKTGSLHMLDLYDAAQRRYFALEPHLFPLRLVTPKDALDYIEGRRLSDVAFSDFSLFLGWYRDNPLNDRSWPCPIAEH